MNVRITRKTLAVAAVLAAVFAVSAAYAAIPDGGGVIHGCYDKASGQVRVTDSQTNVPKGCTNKEQSLNWNQQGPQGLPGTPGTPGPKGDKGDPGAGDGYILTPDDTVVAGPTPVASLWLPAGSYILQAKLGVFAFTAGHSLNCSFGAGSDLDSGSATTTGNFTQVGLSLMTAHSFRYGGYVTLDCSSASMVSAQRIVISAVAVGDLHFS